MKRFSDMKIYVVTTGEYSDYGIEAIFSSKEKAQEFSNFFYDKSDNYTNKEGQVRIEEYELDKIYEFPKGKLPFVICMEKNGDSTCYQQTPTDFEEAESLYLRTSDSEIVLSKNLWAKDKEHAVKITNERRAFLIANNLWKPKD